MRLVLVDSLDSFTWNLVQAFRGMACDVTVVRNTLTPQDVLDLGGDAVVLGPGPGRPEEAGHLVACARTLPGHLPVLGVCLGHQALGLAFGGALRRHTVCHGHATAIAHHGTGLFAGLPSPVPMGRYHSLVVAEPLPGALIADAHADGALMALHHRFLPAWGVQFHPESVLSDEPGIRLLERFVDAARSSG